MRNLIKILLLTFVAAINIFAQENFVSADGGFAIDLPKLSTLKEDIQQDYGDWYSRGETIKWQSDDSEPSFIVSYAEFEPTSMDFNQPRKKISQKLKTGQLNAFGKLFAEQAKSDSAMFRESQYSLNGNIGKEWHIIFSTHTSIVRVFFVKNTYYFVAARFPKSEDEDKMRKIIDSFRLLTRQEIIDIKVKLAEPKPLPQSPVSDKPFSDAHDENLKGKVKSIVEEYQETPKSKPVKSSESYYNNQGNLIRSVIYDLGHPDSIEVWGYVDKNRVSNYRTTNIHFDDDSPTLSIGAQIDPNAKNLIPDERFDTKYTYKYNDKEQLVEKTEYYNDGRISSIETYTYKGNQREKLRKNISFKSSSKSSQIFDTNGDLIKESSFDDKGRIDYVTTYKYELDTKGNWIVQKSFDNIKIKGKTVLKPSSITYRTITYYD
jgi:hypothetical protein